MYAADYPLSERMTWFWHGHWATAISKVIYPLPMLKQNNTLRKYALGNFKDMARAMVDRRRAQLLARQRGELRHLAQ